MNTPTKIISKINQSLSIFTSKILSYGLEEGLEYVILDETIFYPEGGGQPSDEGFIIGSNFSFKVNNCKKIDGIVFHYGTSKGVVQSDLIVTMEIDKDKRKLHSRIHTAGHLIYNILFDLNYKKTSILGYHFPNKSYIKYPLNDQIPENFLQILNSRLELDIANNKKVFIHFNKDNLERSVEIEGYEKLGCGGTHVLNLIEIGKINVNKIEKDSIYYELIDL